MIEGVVITPLKEIKDTRGVVLHMLRSDAETYGGFGECYFSEVLPGCVKAWKKHTKQTQNLAVPIGGMRLVLYDDRQYSKSKGNLQIIEMGRLLNYVRVTVPPGIWQGFKCISEMPSLMANCANLMHSPEESESLPVDTDQIPYNWNP